MEAKQMETKEIILEATLKMYGKKGLKFTMDDIAHSVNMSKKTIYEVFKNKEKLFYEMLEYAFDSIKDSERQVMENEELDTIGKIRAILGVLPEPYKEIDFKQLYVLKKRYPKIYQRLEERLESGWEATIELLKQGMKEGVIRNINIPIFKTMFEASVEQFFQRNVLMYSNISYHQALEEVVNIMMDGIATP